MVYVLSKQNIDTKFVYKKSLGYKWQLEDGIEEWIKGDLGI